MCSTFCSWNTYFSYNPASFTETCNYASLSSADLYYETLCAPTTLLCKIRSPFLKYAIGMIVTHKHKMQDNTQQDITGVIIGWQNQCHDDFFLYKHAYCTPIDIRDEYIREYSIFDWKFQPYYVLLAENSLCYVPQYAITSTCEKWLNNLETGRYFCKFEGTHYVPNKMLEEHYPDDAAVVCQILSNRKI
ncbi:F-box only protein 21-like [Nylanderia fulva]|uniref:F-box only protein 21-like n=1 Tax=Nylanderia fulva TaxID=613905 RepID=UPI0010FB6811|nr:F-box only protein 21-like [Nylanderia fulva]